MQAETGGMRPAAQEYPAPPEAARGRKEPSVEGAIQREHSSVTPGFQISGVQNCERVNVCCFKPPHPPTRRSWQLPGVTVPGLRKPAVRGRGLRSEREELGQGIVSDCSHALVAKLQQGPCGLRSLKYSLPGPCARLSGGEA